MRLRSNRSDEEDACTTIIDVTNKERIRSSSDYFSGAGSKPDATFNPASIVFNLDKENGLIFFRYRSLKFTTIRCVYRRVPRSTRVRGVRLVIAVISICSSFF